MGTVGSDRVWDSRYNLLQVDPARLIVPRGPHPTEMRGAEEAFRNSSMSDFAQRAIAENKRTRNPFLDLGKCELTDLPAQLAISIG